MQTKNKIAICTTFPESYFDLCAAEMLGSFRHLWPKDIKAYIQLDPTTEEKRIELNNKIITAVGDDRAFIASDFDEDQKRFIERWKDKKPESYLKDVVRFSYKVFALEKCADAIKDDIDYLVWVDADVITKKHITHEWLEQYVLPKEETCSYLGRSDLVGYSECGFVVYNLRKDGHGLLQKMREMYTSDSFVGLPGWTDCHVFDKCKINYKTKNLSPHAVGLDAFPQSPLGTKLSHRKGDRKAISKKLGKEVKKDTVVDVGSLGIKTKNCVDTDVIRKNISENLSQIRNWVCLARPDQNKKVVFCSAGPSLQKYISNIKEHQRNGDVIVAVKHAMKTLSDNGITPDFCVLLDPRAHVEGFVEKPDLNTCYLVASMVDPSVVKTLNEKECMVMGYHALVNAGEEEFFNANDLPVAGGSATTTRSISLFCDMFGYKDVEIYGCDLCYYEKPNLQELNEEGAPKHIEITLQTITNKGKTKKRTFWTEGQFLAQAQELLRVYKDRKDIDLKIHGDGLPAWMLFHQKQYDLYVEDYNIKIANARTTAPTTKELLNGFFGRVKLNRGH